MLDMKFLRNNPEIVKENIRKKFQDQKLPLVDEVIEFDRKFRAAKTRCDELRNQRNVISKQIGGLMAQGKKEEAEAAKAQVKAMAEEMAKLEEDEKVYAEEVKARMCCATANFDQFFLVAACADGQERRGQVIDKASGQACLDHISAKNPSVKIGYVKPQP